MPLEVSVLLGQIATVATMVFLACLCLIASAHKFFDLLGFKKIVEDYQVLPAALISLAVWGLPLFELIIGIAVLLPATSSIAAFAIGGLFALYAVAMLSTILRGKKLEDCGCGGPAQVRGQAQVLGAWHIVRNLILVVMAMWVAMGNAGVLQMVDMQTWLLIIPASVFLVLLYWVADTLAANHVLMNPVRNR